MNDASHLTAKLPISEATKRRNPGMWPEPNQLVALDARGKDTKSIRAGPPKPRLNKTETRWRDVLVSRGFGQIMEQAITLRLDPPFKSYTPDLAYVGTGGLVCVECKGPHRFREKGIAKAALAAKTYPQFKFVLADWTGKEWKESVLTP